MANKFQVKRTTVSGRTPNTTNAANTQYIDAGELALNLTDRKLFSSNGSASFEVGANLASIVVGTAFTQTSGNANFDSGVLFVDGTNNRVGVGTATPAFKLHVTGNMDAGTNRFLLDNDGGGSAMMHAGIAGITNGGWSLSTGSANGGSQTVRMVVSSTGDVGIGIATPVNNSGYGGLSINGTSGAIVSMYQGGSETFRITNATGYSFVNTTGATPLLFGTNALERMRITDGGNVGIGTNNPLYKLEVNGSFAATTKSFVINHPTKPDMKLRYGSLEGPENGVYVRGRNKGDTIQLPDYWTGLIDEFSITVNLTPIGSHQKLYVKKIENNTVIVGGGFFDQMEYFYTVFAERKDVDKLIVEI